MGLWSGIKYALNSTLGTNKFMSLDTISYSQMLLQNLNSASIDFVFQNAPRLGELINNTYGLNDKTLAGLKTIDEIANNKQALITISNSIPVAAMFEASAIALTALANSSLRQTASYQANQTATVRRNEKLFLISVRQGSGGSASDTVNFYVSPTMLGNSTITISFTDTYNRDGKIERFMSNLTTRTNSGASGGVSANYTFISLT